MRVLMFVFFFCSHRTHCQNLLANGSFEDENICTEFHEKCSPAGWINVSIGTPLIINSYANDGKALEGARFIKIIAANRDVPECRTFISTKLLCSMRGGNNYLVTFSARASFVEMDSLGIVFSGDNFLSEKRSFKNISPNIWITFDRKDSSVVHREWVRKSYVYTATGGEAYLTLGVFKRNDFQFTKSNMYDSELYVYLDCITLAPINKNEKLCLMEDSIRNEIYGQHDRHSRLTKSRFNIKPLIVKQPITIVLSIDTVEIPSIYFDSGNAGLRVSKISFLDSLIDKLRTAKIDSIIIEGHTDSIGNYQNNEKLSALRAYAVFNYMKQNNLPPNVKVLVRPYGYTRPIAANATLNGRAKNRRVQIIVYGKE